MTLTPQKMSKVTMMAVDNGNGSGRSNTSSPSLHIEWTPESVRSLDVATGRSAEGANLSEISSQLGSRQALVAVGHSSVFLKSVRLPKASYDDLRNVVMVQLGTLFPLPPGQLSFDILQTTDQSAEGFLTVVAAIRSDDLRRIRIELQQAGISASRILPLALAAPAVAQHAGLTDAIVAGRENSGLTLDVVQGGILRSSRVAALTADPIIEVRRTLAAARAEESAVLTVGKLDIPQSTPSMESLLGLLHEAPAIKFELQEERLLAIKKHIDQRTRLGVLMLLAAFCFIVGVWSMWSDQQTALQSSQASWNSRITRQTTIENAEAATLATILPVKTTLERAYEPGQKLSDICSVVTDSLPKNAWLTGLTVQRGVAMDVRGTAMTSGDVGSLVSNLGSDPRFRDVRLTFANTAQVNKTPVEQFDVSAVCVGNLPMPEPIKAKARTRAVPTPASSSSTGGSQ